MSNPFDKFIQRPLVASTPSQTAVTARLVTDDPQLCPYCQKNMEVVKAAGTPVYVCWADRNVLPMPD